MQFCMEYGDTNFIGVVNSEKYKSFVDSNWKLDGLMNHFTDEMKNGNILVFQMTKEGIEHSWKVEVTICEELPEQKCYRKAYAYIKVTDNQLFLVDYDCLTMAAQFAHHKVPNKNCSKYRIPIENGVYRVEIVQFYNVDRNEYVGSDEKEFIINFTKEDVFNDIVNKVFWCIF